ncbi:unnamed protein product, partial [Mycena citricolor]
HIMVTLLDCPNELLLIISEYLNDEGLLHFASTCIRVNSLLIHILLERCQCEAVVSSTGAISSVYFTGDNLGAIPALAIAYHATSIELLSCGFSSFFRSSSSKEILNAVKALDVLAKRLERLSHVRIHPLLKFPGTKKEYVSWQKLLALSLNSAALRGDCSITVHNEPYEAVVDPFPFSHSFSDRPVGHIADERSAPAEKPIPRRPRISTGPGSSLIQRLAALLERVIRALKPHTVAITRSDEPEPSAPLVKSTERASKRVIPLPVLPALKSLNIHSSLLFHTTFYRWTMHTLNTSPLTSLSLDNIDLSLFDWHETLPRLSLAVLDHLHLGMHCSIAVPDLKAFLHRHPSITSLDLSFHEAIGPLHAPGPALPNLRRIRATPEYLVYFLSGPPAGDIHPLLREVTITSHGGSVYEEDRFAKVVAALEKRGSVPAVGLVGKLMGVLDLPETLVPLGNTLEEDENGNR